MTRPRRVGVLAVAAFALLANLGHLWIAGDGMRPRLAVVETRMAIVELEDGQVGEPFSYGLFSEITNESYLESVERYGSFTPTVDELRRESEALRGTADELLGSRVSLEELPARRAGAPEGCRQVRGDGEAVTFRVPPGGVVLRARSAAEVGVRRFASGFGLVGELRADRFTVLRLPSASPDPPWYASVATAGPVTVCPPDEAP